MSEGMQGARCCPRCSEAARAGFFDISVRGQDGHERQFFGLRAALCRSCRRLLLEGDLLRLLWIDEAEIAFGIESDRYLSAGSAEVA